MTGAPGTEAALSRPVATRLAELGLQYEILRCEPELADTAAFCAHYGFALEDSANTIIVASQRQPRVYAAAVVLAGTRLDVNRAMRRLMDVSRASFATPDETVDLTGMAVGGITPFALPEGVPVHVDARVMDRQWVIVGGGNRSSKLRVSPSVFVVAGFRVVSDLAIPRPGSVSA